MRLRYSRERALKNLAQHFADVSKCGSGGGREGHAVLVPAGGGVHLAALHELLLRQGVEGRDLRARQAGAAPLVGEGAEGRLGREAPRASNRL